LDHDLAAEFAIRKNTPVAFAHVGFCEFNCPQIHCMELRSKTVSFVRLDKFFHRKKILKGVAYKLAKLIGGDDCGDFSGRFKKEGELRFPDSVSGTSAEFA